MRIWLDIMTSSATNIYIWSPPEYLGIVSVYYEDAYGSSRTLKWYPQPVVRRIRFVSNSRDVWASLFSKLIKKTWLDSDKMRSTLLCLCLCLCLYIHTAVWLTRTQTWRFSSPFTASPVFHGYWVSNPGKETMSINYLAFHIMPSQSIPGRQPHQLQSLLIRCIPGIEYSLPKPSAIVPHKSLADSLSCVNRSSFINCDKTSLHIIPWTTYSSIHPPSNALPCLPSPRSAVEDVASDPNRQE